MIMAAFKNKGHSVILKLKAHFINIIEENILFPNESGLCLKGIPLVTALHFMRLSAFVDKTEYSGGKPFSYGLKPWA